MSMDVFRACIQGYADHVFDMQLLGVQSGYWAGYYSRAKKPKPIKSIIQNMLREKNRDTKHTKGVRAPEVDVAGFLAMEQKFKEKQTRGGE